MSHNDLCSLQQTLHKLESSSTSCNNCSNTGTNFSLVVTKITRNFMLGSVSCNISCNNRATRQEQQVAKNFPNVVQLCCFQSLYFIEIDHDCTEKAKANLLHFVKLLNVWSLASAKWLKMHLQLNCHPEFCNFLDLVFISAFEWCISWTCRKLHIKQPQWSASSSH